MTTRRRERIEHQVVSCYAAITSWTTDTMQDAAAATIDGPAIQSTYAVIAPRIRTTPVVEADGRDFGLSSFPLAFKLEQL